MLKRLPSISQKCELYKDGILVGEQIVIWDMSKYPNTGYPPTLEVNGETFHWTYGNESPRKYINEVTDDDVPF